MSQENIAEVEAPVTTKGDRSKKAKTAKTYPTKLDSKAKTAAEKFDFAGKVESINVQGTGVGNSQYLFSLMDKKGAIKSYLLDPSEPLRFSAMAGLLFAASTSGVKVKIRSVPNDGGPNYASELEVRARG
jgi:hypothetical protein